MIYTQLNENDICEIAAQYNLIVTGFKQMTGGSTNSSYEIETQRGRFVLTLFEERTPDQIIELGQLLLLLEQHRFPTTRLVRPNDGGITTRYQGKPIMLKAYVAGQVCEKLDRSMLHQVGTAMAKLHQVPVPDFLTNRWPYGSQKFAVIQSQNIDTKYTRWITRRLPYLEKQRPQGLPGGLVHGDVFYDNVLFENTKLAAIIDFEDALRHDMVFDLGMGIVGLCRAGTKVVLEKAQALVQGYQQIRKLQERERNALQWCVEYAATTISCWRFWKYHIAEPDATKFDKHWPMVHTAEELRGISESIFLSTIFG